MDILPALISTVVGFFLGIFSEPLRELVLKPNLEFEFGQGKDFITKTPEIRIFKPIKGPFSSDLRLSALSETHVTTDAYYIRVKVTNNGKYLAKDCRVYLVSIEKKDGTGKFRRTIYCDSIQLAWSCRGDRETGCQGIDFPYKIDQFVDIVTTFKNVESFSPQLWVTPLRYKPLFQEKGVFRFTILLSAKSVEPRAC